MAKEEKPLHVVELFVEKFMKISTLLIKPTGTMVEVTGKNGNGKSSALDAMWTALAGASVAPIKPIKTGAEKATIRLSLGDLIVTRTFKKKPTKNDKDEVIGEAITTDVTVESAEGARFPSPQKILATFYDELTLDPTEFERMDDKGKFNALKKFVPGFDFENAAGLTLKDTEDRKIINRQLNETLTAATQIEIAANVPDEPVDEVALITELENAGAKNLEIEQRKNRREAADVRVLEIDRMIAAAGAFRDQNTTRAQQRCAEIMAEAETTNANSVESENRITAEKEEIQTKRANAAPLPDPVDVSELRKRIDYARILNTQVDAKKRQKELAIKATDLDNKSKALTAAIMKRETEKQAAIKAAALPVPGLGFGDGVILFNGEPFDQASQAERIKTSAAIAMASNPRLRVLRLKHGNDLDEDSMKMLCEMAAAQNFQVWIERINATGPMGFVLEDGHLKTQP